MSLYYFIDGYNVIHSTTRWESLSRSEQRERFLHSLDEERPTGSSKNMLTVVLDGFAAPLRGIRLAHVRLLFSGEVDADTVIRERVKSLSNPKDAVVVTNDRGLRAAVKRLGARVMAVEDFLKLGQKKSIRPSPDKLDSNAAHDINAELKRIWKI